VTETGLIVAGAVLLLLLYVFVAWVARSSYRTMRLADAAPPAPPVPTPEPEPAAAPAPAPAPAREPAVLAGVGGAAAARSRERSRPSLDLTGGVSPRLVVESSPTLAAAREYPLEGGLTIGRSGTSQLPVSDAFISHTHARVVRHGQFFYIEDLGSTNGTFLNGRRVGEPTRLKVHDEVRLGETVLRYEE
jgi:hypothetical protein